MKNMGFLVFALVLAGCAGERIEQGPPPPMDEFAMDKSYLIGVGDQLQIQVWRNEELSANVPVRPDGKISSPLVGDVVAAGKSTEQLAKEITAQLGNYLRNPEVTVIVSDPASADFLRRVRVTGAVRNPVSISYRQGITALDLVLEAGGLTEFASANNARLYRTVEGVTKVYAVRLGDILEDGNLSTNYPLSPSDVLTIPERNF